MEKAVTQHLKNVNAYLTPDFKAVVFDSQEFKTEAEYFKVHKTTIWEIIHRKIWRHI